MKKILLCASLILAAVTNSSHSETIEERSLYRGQLLPAAVDHLQKQGLRVIYSKNLVKPWMRVYETPTEADLSDMLLQLLKPHGLTAELKAANTWVITEDEDTKKNQLGALRGKVFDSLSGEPIPQALVTSQEQQSGVATLSDGTFLASELQVGIHSLSISAPGYKLAQSSGRVRSDRITQIEIALEPEAPRIDEIKIIASRHEMYSNSHNGGQFLSREDVDRAPHIADDLSRAVARLPGLAGGDIFARLNLRGGRPNELRVNLDGLELYNPFHVKDLGGLLSVVDTNVIQGLDLISGGYTAEFGDVMSGVVDIESLAPSSENEYELGVTFVNMYGRAQGSFAQGNGHWLVSARRGYLDFLFDIVEEEDEDFEPRYGDLLSKVGYEFSDKTRFNFNILLTNDDLFLVDADPRFPEQNQGESSSNYIWTTLENDWTDTLDSKTTISYQDHDRFRIAEDFDGTFAEGILQDRRKSNLFGIKSNWRWAFADSQMLKWGAEYSLQEATYNYDLIGFNTGVLGGEPRSDFTRQVNRLIDGEEHSAYLAYRFRPFSPVTMELGLRWDKQTYTDLDEDDQLSSRFNLLYQLTSQTKLRVAWGHFYQAQRIQELQIEDGVEDFLPAQRAEHRILGLTHKFNNGLQLRADLYQKRYTDVQPYYENFLDPAQLIPEIEPDRIRIAPESSEAKGLEVLVKHDPDRILDWWVSYAYSRATDRIDGNNVLRSWDQTHALNFGLNWHWSNWNVNLAGGLHTGRPFTNTDVDTFPDPNLPGNFLGTAQLGLRNMDRIDTFHRFDIRVSRRVELRDSQLDYFFEVYNIFNSHNPCCVEGFDFDFDSSSSSFFSIPRSDSGMPRLPSFGVSWRF